jgi:hypothetical protein
VPKKTASELRVEWPQVAAFRLARQHLDGGRAADVASLCRDACGMQAQMLSAAYLALWTRNQALTRKAIDAALHQTRTLVKTSVMRSTLHLLDAADYSLYIRALCASRLRHMRRVMARYGGITARDADAVRSLVVTVLGDGPALKREVQKRVLAQRKVSTRARKFFALGWWGVVRQAIVEGLICYGPEREGETALIRTADWLGQQKDWSEREAQQELLRRYLRAYGPATLRDFAYWSGFSIGEARPVWESLREEMTEFAGAGGGGKGCAALARDGKRLLNSHLREPAVSLLPNFDVYLLGHADKSNLLDLRHYQCVFRKGAWISPTVLLNGRVAGVWSSEIRGKRLRVSVQPFEKLSARVRAHIKEEGEALGQFLSLAADVRIAR